MEELVKYSYGEHEIPFNKDENGEVWINATEMAKLFNKKTTDFLKTSRTKEFIERLSEVKDVNSSDLVDVRYGDRGGSWMHEDIAIEFARWLSPDFGIWCNNKIKELLHQGYTKLDNISRKDLAKMLWEAEEEKERLEKENETMLPKAKGYDEVVSSDGFLSLKEAANSLRYGRQKFINKLRDLNIFIKQKPLPYQRYIDNGYFTVKDKVTGNGHIVSVALVSSKGIDYIFRKLNETEQQKSLKIV